jgi:hypothetical protein
VRAAHALAATLQRQRAEQDEQDRQLRYQREISGSPRPAAAAAAAPIASPPPPRAASAAAADPALSGVARPTMAEVGALHERCGKLSDELAAARRELSATRADLARERSSRSAAGSEVGRVRRWSASGWTRHALRAVNTFVLTWLTRHALRASTVVVAVMLGRRRVRAQETDLVMMCHIRISSLNN